MPGESPRRVRTAVLAPRLRYILGPCPPARRASRNGAPATLLRAFAVRRAVLAVGRPGAARDRCASALFAGSPSRLAAGNDDRGLDVGGLEPRRGDERRSSGGPPRSSARRSTFVAGGRTFALTRVPARRAARLGCGRPLRGGRAATGLRPFAACGGSRPGSSASDVAPRSHVYPSVLRVHGRADRRGGRPPRRRRGPAAHGLSVVVVPGPVRAHPRPRQRRRRRSSRRSPPSSAAGRSGCRSSAPSRGHRGAARGGGARPAGRRSPRPSTLTRRADPLPAPALADRRAPELPSGRRDRVAVAGAKAQTWLRSLARSVDRRRATRRSGSCPAASSSSRRSRAARSTSRTPGRRSSGGLLPDRARGDRSTHSSEPERTTAEAKAMGITGIVGSYTTTYGGTPGGSTTSGSWPS